MSSKIVLEPRTSTTDHDRRTCDHTRKQEADVIIVWTWGVWFYSILLVARGTAAVQLSTMDIKHTTKTDGPATNSAPAREATVRNRSGILTALAITGFSTFLNLYVTQPLLPQLRQVFRASELLVSLTVSAPVLAVALTASVIGLLADALGRKRLIVAAMLGLTLPTVLAGTATNLSQLVIWRFLQGFFIAGISTVTIAYISEESPPRSVGSIMATHVTGNVVGGFAGRFIAGLSSARYGWRAPFVILGVITCAGALVTWWLLPRSARFVRQHNMAQAVRAMRMHLHNPMLLATYAVGFNVLFCLVAAFTYVNFYLADKPFLLGPTALASIFVVYLIGAAITPVAGHIMDRVGYRRALMGAVGVSAVGMILTLIQSVPVIIAGLTLEATGVFACQSASTSHVGKAAHEARSSATGLYMSFYYLGGFAGSILPGLLWRHAGWSGCVAIMLCMQAGAILIANRWWQR
jgi:MFS transporter, YNFM family, putative membrane transport protein